MPTKLDEFIENNPEYQSIPKEQVFEAFYKKYYADKISREDLRERLGEPPVGSPPGEAPPRPSQNMQRQSWGEVAGRAIENLAPSAWNNLIQAPIEFAKEAVTSPAETFGKMVAPIAGAVRQIPGLEAAPDDPMGQQSEQAYENLAEVYGNRYGSLEGFKESLASDPVALLGDAAAIGVPAARVSGLAAHSPQLLNTAARVATNPVGEAAGAAVRHIGNIPSSFMGPRNRARATIADISERYPNAPQDLALLGPQGVVADTLGVEGGRRARAAGNLSPEAADVLDRFADVRAEGRGERLATAEEDVRAAHRPGINQAYEEAKAQGREFPRVVRTNPPVNPFMSPTTTVTNIPLGFQDLIDDPLLRPFWNKSERIVAALEREGPQGDFARIDKFRSYLNRAAHTSRDPTQQLAFEEAVREIDNVLEQQNLVPGREAARASHRAMEADVELANEEAQRIERRFARTHQQFRGNSTTAEQAVGVANVLERANIVGDVIRGNYSSAIAKVTGLFLGKGMERAQAQRLAAQMVEEARILVGREYPTRPLASQIQQGGQLLGDMAAYTTLLGGRQEAADQLLLTRGGIR